MTKNIYIAAALLALTFSSIAGAICNANVNITKPNSIYIDTVSGTVTDTQTGLMWMKCSQGQNNDASCTGTATVMNWKRALEASQAANRGSGMFGYTDWRLPGHKELASLVEKACYNPSINTNLFPATVSDWYWSASLNADSTDGAWLVNYYYGGGSNRSKNSSYYVRLVRGGN